MKSLITTFLPKVRHPTFIIAEIGINHGGSLDQAIRLIDSAASTGCDAVKFQTYITEKRVEADSPIFEILKKCELPLENFKVLKDRAESKGLTFFSTPFDKESVDAMQAIDVELYKAASFDLANLRLLKHLASLGKPVILSTGLSEIEEVEKAVSIFDDAGCPLALLHCISSYPTDVCDANLAAIQTLRARFGQLPIGQSDHTKGIKVPLYAVAMGACILEKHYCINENDECVDGSVSIHEAQMKTLVSEVREVEMMIGDGTIAVSEAEKPILRFRRVSS